MSAAAPGELLFSAASAFERVRQEAEALLRAVEARPLADLLAEACELRDRGHRQNISYSRKVFIPLTQLCRDVCHYCTFAHAPRADEKPYLSIDQMVAIAQAGKKAGCKEALFTLGDKPELRYRIAREELDVGHPTTLSYVAEAASAVFRETGLLAHINPGLMTGEDIDALRKVSVSQGVMLESVSARLGEKGGAHYGSPDKAPAARLETMRLAGERSVPFTTGMLIGIGGDRRERIDTLLAMRDLHRAYGHIQEIIIQNFRAKPATLAATHRPMWTSSPDHCRRPPDVRPEMNMQAPPQPPRTTTPAGRAGLNDWGGISPVTPDHVNPEAPWPHVGCSTRLRRRRLHAHAAVADVPRFVDEPGVDPALRTRVAERPRLLPADTAG